MESLILIATIVSIHILAWLTPGPNFVLIVRNSLIYSRKTGIWTALGIAMGNSIHILYSVIGLTLIVSASDIATNIIKFLGFGYLTYLGIKTILINTEKQKSSKPKKHKDLSRFNAAKTGFLVNILSPKASLFFASIFGALIAIGTSWWVIISLMVIMPLDSFVMASLLSLFFTTKSIKSFYSKYEFILNKVLGALLIAFAVMIVLL